MSQHHILASLLSELEENLRDPLRLEQMVVHISMEIESRRIEWIMTKRLLDEIEAKHDHPARSMYFLMYPDGKYHASNQFRASSALAATRYTADEVGINSSFNDLYDYQRPKEREIVGMRDGLRQHLTSLRRMINMLRMARCNLKSRDVEVKAIRKH